MEVEDGRFGSEILVHEYELAPSGPPRLRHAVDSIGVKNEDMFTAYTCNTSPCEPISDGAGSFDSLSSGRQDCWSFFCLCDGHNGGGASTFVEEHLWNELSQRLPTHLPTSWDSEEGKACTAQVRTAVLDALVVVDAAFRTLQVQSGCAITVALVGGWMLTVANLGDALGFLDTGTHIVDMTVTHRLHDSKLEQGRLLKAGVSVAPMSLSLSGPAKHGEEGSGYLRVWPGGLAVSRSMGDIDVRPEVVCLPHIRQVVVPQTGGRFVTASGSVWDMVSKMKALKVARKAQLDDAPAKVIGLVKAATCFQLSSDVIVAAVDILPAGVDDFTMAVKEIKPPKGLLPRFFARKPVTTLPGVVYLANVDTIQERPPEICWPEPSSIMGSHSIIGTHSLYSSAQSLHVPSSSALLSCGALLSPGQALLFPGPPTADRTPQMETEGNEGVSWTLNPLSLTTGSRNREPPQTQDRRMARSPGACDLLGSSSEEEDGEEISADNFL
ncbi:unnamed protein product [Ostreobium quekettii]|uniref:PPM-type phosphatase domain-containing protein n=1 Tax=Ostreobium quekettii TaxID=121088 RepID=A0A8S1J669_9CHLO|nr:unnamed protein product [Ostreobium quekettii]|eukprot:evm.model.scf_702.1 EVM.evm.TU.scf_702.1   scf_702:4748-10448(+)